MGAILNTRGRFGPPMWAPVLNNVVVIATRLVFVLLPGPAPADRRRDDATAQITACSARDDARHRRADGRAGAGLRRPGSASGSAARPARLAARPAGPLGPLGVRLRRRQPGGYFVVVRLATGAPVGGRATRPTSTPFLLFQLPHAIVAVSRHHRADAADEPAAAASGDRHACWPTCRGLRLAAVGAACPPPWPSWCSARRWRRWSSRTARSPSVERPAHRAGARRLRRRAGAVQRLPAAAAGRSTRWRTRARPTLVNLGVNGVVVVLVLFARCCPDNRDGGRPARRRTRRRTSSARCCSRSCCAAARRARRRRGRARPRSASCVLPPCRRWRLAVPGSSPTSSARALGRWSRRARLLAAGVARAHRVLAVRRARRRAAGRRMRRLWRRRRGEDRSARSCCRARARHRPRSPAGTGRRRPTMRPHGRAPRDRADQGGPRPRRPDRGAP